MLKTIARWSVLAIAFTVLTVPATRMYADNPPPPTVVTGGDPEPMGEIILRTIGIIPSLAVL